MTKQNKIRDIRKLHFLNNVRTNLHQSKISVLLPVKNTSEYLRTCLDSIIQQTTKNWELIAVDDHSTDGSHDILKQYAAQDDRIIVLQNQGSGIIDALQLAYHHSTGEYITRMDSDDIMMPSKVELLRTSLKERGPGHLAVGSVRYFCDGELGDGYRKYADWLNGLTADSNNFSEIYKECVIPSPCWMIHREDFDACGGFNSDIYPEDYDLCFRFYQARLKIVGIPTVLHHWRDYPHRTSRTHEHYADNRFLNLKIMYFIMLDYREQSKLTLWGGGKKGKLIAQHLIRQRIDFTWVTNNKKKIGKHIYGRLMESYADIEFSSLNQIILAVANQNEQQDILTLINKYNKPIDTYLFC